MKHLKIYFALCLISIGFNAFSQKKFVGTFSNGFKGAKLSFTLTADGKQVQSFTFDGYWRCGGSTEHIKAGLEKSFSVVNGKIQGVILDPENGGASAFRFNLEGVVNGKHANGTFRMNITGLSCDTYKLNWTAVAI
ncbi:hypothetical protein EZ428_06495 [Pedobacter frigiditerrae]|uniref:Uncharacterized protein n=1 Tax=Pedobacter frigiditerrae TaxID=2530452 RepID=A0A4R0N4V3_9SPHI|nr:hypothetical protein [Pedobacter frigiditerrae]TCC94417.1 hypothetical protein EZ428_06495 [Pedobacter frigiditerrae]